MISEKLKREVSQIVSGTGKSVSTKALREANKFLEEHTNADMSSFDGIIAGSVDSVLGDSLEGGGPGPIDHKEFGKKLVLLCSQNGVKVKVVPNSVKKQVSESFAGTSLSIDEQNLQDAYMILKSQPDLDDQDVKELLVDSIKDTVDGQKDAGYEGEEFDYSSFGGHLKENIDQFRDASEKMHDSLYFGEDNNYDGDSEYSGYEGKQDPYLKYYGDDNFDNLFKKLKAKVAAKKVVKQEKKAVKKAAKVAKKATKKAAKQEKKMTRQADKTAKKVAKQERRNTRVTLRNERKQSRADARALRSSTRKQAKLEKNLMKNAIKDAKKSGTLPEGYQSGAGVGGGEAQAAQPSYSEQTQSGMQEAQGSIQPAMSPDASAMAQSLQSQQAQTPMPEPAAAPSGGGGGGGGSESGGGGGGGMSVSEEEYPEEEEEYQEEGEEEYSEEGEEDPEEEEEEGEEEYSEEGDYQEEPETFSFTGSGGPSVNSWINIGLVVVIVVIIIIAVKKGK